MGGHQELIWFGLALAGIGAGFAFIFWSPIYEEGDDHYAPLSAGMTVRRVELLLVGIIIAALGLWLAIWHTIKLLIA